MTFQLQNIQEGWKQAVVFLWGKLNEDDALDFAFFVCVNFYLFHGWS